MGKEREKKKRNRSLSARRSTYNNVSAIFFVLFSVFYIRKEDEEKLSMIQERERK